MGPVFISSCPECNCVLASVASSVTINETKRLHMDLSTEHAMTCGSKMVEEEFPTLEAFALAPPRQLKPGLAKTKPSGEFNLEHRTGS